MPNTKSAKKRLKQSALERTRNMAVKSRMKTVSKKAVPALQSSNRAAAEAAVREAFRYIDKAAGKGVIHPNQAARRKSRLAAKLNAVK